MPNPGGVHNLVPFAHASDLESSIGFYEKLGFEATDTFRPRGELSWCMLESGAAKLMLAAADSPVDRDGQGVLFYLYTERIEPYRDRLESGGIRCGTVEPGPTGLRQMRVDDPDGYCLMIAEIPAAELDR